MCICGKRELHPVRIELGYKTCVECSTTQAYGCAPITNHKTGNSIQIMTQEQFNGLIFRDGMVFISEIDKWVTYKEYEKLKQNDKI